MSDKDMPKSELDFIHWVCSKCPDEIDDPDEFPKAAGYPDGCSCNATRCNKPTLCPCRGEPSWVEDTVLIKGEDLK
jgi:hypothetical protein